MHGSYQEIVSRFLEYKTAERGISPATAESYGPLCKIVSRNWVGRVILAHRADESGAATAKSAFRRALET